MWAIPAVPFDQAHYRQLQQRKLASISFSDGDFDNHIELDVSARSELLWCAENLHLANGKPIKETDPDLGCVKRRDKYIWPMARGPGG